MCIRDRFAYSAELEEKLARQYELNAQLDLENAKAMDADLGGPDEEKSEDRDVYKRQQEVLPPAEGLRGKEKTQDQTKLNFHYRSEEHTSELQ